MKTTPEQKNYAFCQETIERLNQIESDYLARAEDLHRIRSLSLYRPSWDTFEEFCMELKSLKYKSIMKLIGIYETFVLQYKIAPARITQAGGWSSVAEILPVVKNKKDAEEWLTVAETSTRQHLRQHIQEAETGKDMRKCAHKNAYVIHVCPDCKIKSTSPL